MPVQKNYIQSLFILIASFWLATAFVHTAVAQATVYDTPGSHTFTVPNGVTKLKVRLWGGGGGGARITSIRAGGGGGAGAYSYAEFPVQAGTSYTIIVGPGREGTASADNGGASEIKLANQTIVKANGGIKAANNSDIGAAGGAAWSLPAGNPYNLVQTTFLKGGDGDNGKTSESVESGAGGNSPAGGVGGESISAIGSHTGKPGQKPGGGGSGARRSTTLSGNYDGGKGGDGKVEIEFFTCYETEEKSGNYFGWFYPADGAGADVNGTHYPNGDPTPAQVFTQPPADGGFTLDIYTMDNSFNMEINGQALHTSEIQFEKDIVVDGVAMPRNIRFKSDASKYQENNVDPIWKINEGVDISNTNRYANPTPAIRISIDIDGSVKFYGKRNTGAALEELELFDPNNNNIALPNPTVNWSATQDNTISVTQVIQRQTHVRGWGYGIDVNPEGCETYEVAKTGKFVDANNDGYAQAGEFIEYEITIENGDTFDVEKVTIDDPIIGVFEVNNQMPTYVTSFTGDTNNDYILGVNETWILKLNYPITNDNIFESLGVYNQAKVRGTIYISTLEINNIEHRSTDPTPLSDRQQLEGWDDNNPYGNRATYVPLKGVMTAINPMLLHPSKSKTDKGDLGE